MPTKATVTSTTLISVIRKGIGRFCASGFYARVPVRLQLSLHGFQKSRLPHCLWTIRGYTSLLVPGHDPPQDIRILMDVSLNPGPDLTGGWLLHDRFSTSQVVGRLSHTNSPSLAMKYYNTNISNYNRFSKN